MTMIFREALNETIKCFNLKAANIAAGAGMQPSELSRYRHGRSDIRQSRLYAIVMALPDEARFYFFALSIAKSDEKPSK